MPGKAAERMLSLYSRAIYTKDLVLSKIYLGLPDVGVVAGILAKWAAIQNAPSDVITVVVYELLRTQNAVRNPPQIKPAAVAASAAPQAQRSPLADFLDEAV